MEVIKEELMDVRNRFADDRRTRIQDAVEDISILDLIEDEEQVITMSVRGYIKRMSNDEFQEQRRGGKGKRGVKSKKEDAAKDIFCYQYQKRSSRIYNAGNHVQVTSV